MDAPRRADFTIVDEDTSRGAADLVRDRHRSNGPLRRRSARKGGVDDLAPFVRADVDLHGAERAIVLRERERVLVEHEIGRVVEHVSARPLQVAKVESLLAVEAVERGVRTERAHATLVARCDTHRVGYAYGRCGVVRSSAADELAVADGANVRDAQRERARVLDADIDGLTLETPTHAALRRFRDRARGSRFDDRDGVRRAAAERCCEDREVEPQNLMPFSARCFHHRYVRTAAGTAATTAVIGKPRRPMPTAAAVVAPATVAFLRESVRTSERDLDMAPT